MPRLSNSPQAATILGLEARKSFSFALMFQGADGNPLDITGSSVSLVAAELDRFGVVKQTLIDTLADITSPEHGVARFNLQASDLDFTPGSYRYTVTLISDGYSTVVLKGPLELIDNLESAATGQTYIDHVSTQDLNVVLRENSVHVDLPYDLPPDVARIPPGGTTGQPLVKLGTAPGAVGWGAAGGSGGPIDAGSQPDKYAPVANGDDTWDWRRVALPSDLAVSEANMRAYTDQEVGILRDQVNTNTGDIGDIGVEIGDIVISIGNIGTDINNITQELSDLEDTVVGIGTSADGKNKIYYQADMPSGGPYSVGDTWFDTDNGYKIYRWDGYNWIAVELGGAALSDAAIDTAQIALGAVTALQLAQGAVGTDALDDSIELAITTAGAAATSAQNTADEAQTKALEAEQDAYDAQQAADAAQAAADSATGDAAAAQQAADDAQAAADQALADAALARTIADAAQAAADAADLAAAAAQQAADAAQTTADGKNRVIRSQSPASGMTYQEGDQWWQFSGSDVVGFWLYNDNNQWIPQEMTDAIIANLDAAKITTGYLDAARIQAQTITGTMIAAGTVAASNMIAGTITAASGIIADATIGTAQIINSSITNAKIANLDASKITTGYLDAGRIAAGIITGTMIAGQTIVGANIAAGQIAAGHIVANTIGVDQLVPSIGEDLDISANGTVTIIAGDVATAQSTADNAQNAADAAQATADQAETDAQNALSQALAAQSAADGAISTYYAADPPWPNGSTQDDNKLGDLWFDTDTNQAYRWNGSTWALIQDNSIADALNAAQNAQATADGKITAFYQNTPPTSGMSEHDLWYDTNDNNHPYRRTASAWVSVRDGTIANAQIQADQALADAAAAQAAADQADADALAAQQAAAAAASDAAAADSKAVSAQQAANSAQSTANSAQSAADDAASDAAVAAGIADSKGKVIIQGSAPAASDRLPQNLWIDTTGGSNIPKRWNGSSWEPVTDKTATDAANAAVAAQSTATQAELDAAAAQAKADQAEADAAAADAKAVTAQQAANSAQTTANNAQTAADQAQADADAVQATADAAQQAADDADEHAATAEGKADGAQTAAENAQSAADDAAAAAEGVATDLSDMQTVYSFTANGAYISAPGSPYKLHLEEDRIEMLEGDHVIAYWQGGTMDVDNLVTQVATIGNHVIDGTVAGHTTWRSI